MKTFILTDKVTSKFEKNTIFFGIHTYLMKKLIVFPLIKLSKKTLKNKKKQLKSLTIYLKFQIKILL